MFAVSAMKIVFASSGSRLRMKVSFQTMLVLYLLVECSIVHHLRQHSMITGSAFKAFSARPFLCLMPNLILSFFNPICIMKPRSLGCAIVDLDQHGTQIIDHFCLILSERNGIIPPKGSEFVRDLKLLRVCTPSISGCR